MSEMRDLPEWVWELVAGLYRYEEEHPLLYRMTSTGEIGYERTPCPGGLSRVIPREVSDATELLVRHGAIKAPSMFADEGVTP